MFEGVEPLLAARYLVLSAAFAFVWSSLVGFFMMIPHLRSPTLSKATRRVNFKGLLSAHLDWIMLAFMQGLAAGLLVLFDLSVSGWIIAALIFGGWMIAVPYFLRAFGINAFVYGGGVIQRVASVLGGVSVFAVTAAWIVLSWKAGHTLLG